MELSEKQKEFWTTKPHRWNVKTGATRSGKTWLDYYMIPKPLQESPGLFFYLGTQNQLLKETCWHR